MGRLDGTPIPSPDPDVKGQLARSEHRRARFRLAAVVIVAGAVALYQLVTVGREGALPVPEHQVLSAKALAPIAQEEALQWHNDAHLTRVLLRAAPIDASSSPNAAFFFSSNTSPTEKLSITIREIPGALEIRKEQFEVPARLDLAIGASNWSIDSTDVLATAQASGGDDFLRTHPNAVGVLLILEHSAQGEKGNLRWRVSYMTPKPALGGASLAIIINPLTGDVERVTLSETP